MMELYISDHPLDCLTCAANGDCELQDVAGAVGLRSVRFGSRVRRTGLAAWHRTRAIRTSPSMPRCASSVHGVCAPATTSRARSRSPSRVVASASQVAAGAGGSFFDSDCVSCGACVQVCPDRRAHREHDHRARPAPEPGAHHLWLLRGRVLVLGGGPRRAGGAHGAGDERRCQRGPLLREGPLRLGLRHPPRSGSAPDGARAHRRRVAHRRLGRGDLSCGSEVRRDPDAAMGRTPSAASHRRDAPTRKCS